MIERRALRHALVTGIAECEGYTLDEVEAAVASAGGDDAYELDSKQAEWVVAHVEYLLGVDKPLPKPVDLDRDQFATLAALLDAISHALNAHT